MRLAAAAAKCRRTARCHPSSGKPKGEIAGLFASGGIKKPQSVSSFAAHGRQSTSYSARLAFALGYYLRTPEAGVPLRRFLLTYLRWEPAVSAGRKQGTGVHQQFADTDSAGRADLHTAVSQRAARRIWRPSAATEIQNRFCGTAGGQLSADVHPQRFGSHRSASLRRGRRGAYANARGWKRLGEIRCAIHLCSELASGKHRQVRPTTAMEYRFPVPRSLETLAGTGGEHNLL